MATKENKQRQGAAEGAKQQGKELVSEAQAQVGAKTHELQQQAGARLREQVDQRSTQAGEQAQAIGTALRRSSEQLRGEGKSAPANIVDEVASRADELGAYLQRANADTILSDVEDFARKRPWLVGAAGVVAGFAASRFMKASSARRYEAYGSDRRSTGPRELSRGAL